jgi:hypothetical protein
VLLTRREMLELFRKAPESAGALYPLIIDELDNAKEPLLIEQQLKED